MGGAKRNFVSSSRDHAALVLAGAAESQRVRRLQLLTQLPTVVGPEFDPVQPGWNPKHGIYFDEPPGLAGLIPDKREPQQIASFFGDLFVDFPFKDDASWQNFIGFQLTPLIGPAILACRPMAVVKASLERAGKGLLVESGIGCAVLGRTIPTLQMGATEEEREKRITSLILAGETVVHLDNIPTGMTLNSAALCSLLTSLIWGGRELGHSRTPALPNNLLLIATGNNLRASGEMAKRCVPITLQPLDDHPEDRTNFVHPNIRQYAREKRRELLGILLGMVESWKAAGCPGGAVQLGGFEEWARVVGGILRVAGFNAWMTNYRAWVDCADDWTIDAQAFAAQWWGRFGSNAVTASKALELLLSTRLFPIIAAKPEEARLMVFTKTVLLPMTDRPLQGYRLTRQTSGNNTTYAMTFDPELRRQPQSAPPGGREVPREVPE